MILKIVFCVFQNYISLQLLPENYPTNLRLKIVADEFSIPISRSD
jgi:hypothetical protein